MNLAVVTCSCGKSTWTMSIPGNKKKYFIAGDCDQCKDAMHSPPPKKQTQFVEAMGNVTPLRKKGKGASRGDGTKKRGNRNGR